MNQFGCPHSRDASSSRAGTGENNAIKQAEVMLNARNFIQLKVVPLVAVNLQFLERENTLAPLTEVFLMNSERCLFSDKFLV